MTPPATSTVLRAVLVNLDHPSGHPIYRTSIHGPAHFEGGSAAPIIQIPVRSRYSRGCGVSRAALVEAEEGFEAGDGSEADEEV